jgi:dsDNA-specific endonuclease/ATPase MutS2
MKHIKKFETFVNDSKQESINESLSDMIMTKTINILIGILTIGLTAVVKFTASIILDRIVNGISNIAGNITGNIRRIIKPTDLEKFTKIIENDPQFHKDFLKMLEDIGGIKKVYNWSDFAKDMVKIPSFQKKYAEFVKDKNISEQDADFLLREIRQAIKDTMQMHAEEVIEDIHKKFPETK